MKLARWRAVLALPLHVLVTIPVLLLLWTRDWSWPSPTDWRPWLALLCLAAGGTLMVSTIRRFDREGDGSLAPWDPTRNLVVSGVHRYVRNPMISGVVLNLLGEAAFLGSWSLLAWAGLFLAGNAIYIPRFEEPGLEARFGDSYRRYRSQVPRWIPRISPYDPDAGD